MFRKTILLFAVFIVGIIAAENSETAPKNIPEREINGDLSIISMHNTNTEIAHLPVEYEQMELEESVDGILHYSLGARVRSEYMIFNHFHMASTNSISNFIIKNVHECFFPITNRNCAVFLLEIIL